LLNNIYVFSGAKTYQQTRALTALLAVDEYKSNFYAFKRAAEPIFGTYNQDYLQAEYQTAKASARMASDWKRIEIDKDVLPLLKYQTVGDGRVRPTHQQLDNIVRPVNDPFWKQYYPPNGWRCRCTVAQLAKDEEPLTDMSGFTPPDDVPPLFRMNAGIDGYVFKTKGKDKHPYFDIAREDKANAKVNWNLPIPQAPRPAPIIEVPKVFKPATSIKEAEEFALKYVDKVNYSKLDIEVVNEINKKLEELSIKYNVRINEISFRKNFELYDNIMEVQHSKNAILKDGEVVGWEKKTKLNINNVFFGNKNYKSILKKQFESNWSYSENIGDVLTHEFGHILTNIDKYANDLILRTPIKDISKYGMTNISESIAELFLKREKYGELSLTIPQNDFLTKYISK